MKQRSYYFIFGIFFSIGVVAQQVNFELWNKHTEPIYFNIGNSMQEVSAKSLQLLRPGKWTHQFITTSSPTMLGIAIGTIPAPGQELDVYTIPPGKKIYLRVGLPPEKEKFKEKIKQLLHRDSIEANNYIFGPQVGPLLGFKGITERGHTLSGNLNKTDIIKSKTIYRPAPIKIMQ